MVDFVNVLDGNTFVVSDAQGDIEPSPTFPTGFFSFDTRFLSTWRLTVNGDGLHALGYDDLQYYESRFFLVPGAPTHYVDAPISVIRERTIGGSFTDSLTVLNHGDTAADLTIRMEIGCDFADIFELKEMRARRGAQVWTENNGLYFRYERGRFLRETTVSASEPAQVDHHGMTFQVTVDPRGQWIVRLEVDALMQTLSGRALGLSPREHTRRLPRHIRQELNDWMARSPRLVCGSDTLSEAYERSLVDLAALRYVPLFTGGRRIPAAGLPWFMTIFGRDSLLTSLQALPFQPDLAAITLRFLAAAQGSVLDDFRDQEPGKIPHEIRYGESAAFEEKPHTPYYGSADATPLFVVLLDEYERWTGDAQLVRELELETRLALAWIDRYGDILGNGYLWYQPRNTKTGLENQVWKDSWDSISYHDGTLPAFPRATCELQGYAYDAKMRGARLCREFWDDNAYADILTREAADLKDRFNRDFWIADRGFYALGIDPAGRPVDAMASNMGHLLWSGIAEPSRAQQVVQHLMGRRMFSGWGVRTLADDEGRYNPIGYHVGTIWPFDNSIIAWGLRRYGYPTEAGRIAQGIIDAAAYFHGRLPEAFAGYDRDLTKYPVEYPTACSPQAWSAGTTLLLLRTMLGLEPDRDHLHTDPAIPDRIGHLDLLGIPGRWGRTDVHVQ